MLCLYRMNYWSGHKEYVAGIIYDGYSLTTNVSERFLFDSQEEITEVRKKFPSLLKFASDPV